MYDVEQSSPLQECLISKFHTAENAYDKAYLTQS